MTGRLARQRVKVTAAILGSVFAVLMGRAVQLTVIDGAELRARADRQHREKVELSPKRGTIVDRYGEPLALTRESADVYLRPKDLRAAPAALAALGARLDLAPGAVEAKATAEAPFVWLARQVSLDRWEEVEDLGLAGIGSERTRVRSYPHGPLAGHILGFVNIDGRGLEGVERQLDEQLRGEVVALDVERDARGGRWVPDGRWRPLPRVGATVELTIDSALQRATQSELAKAVEKYGAVAATAVVLDPFTGEILALGNVPEFDPNQFTHSSAAQWRNRALTDSYEPGSTFKAITAAAALEAGAVKPDDQIYCERGKYAVGRRVIHDHHPLAMLSFADVIAHSSNIGTAKVAEHLGRERFAEMIDRFGFGRPTGVDLPGEVGGLLRPVNAWGRIHVVTTAFGQGISVTPLQLTRAFAAIANGGLLMRPYVVRRVVDETGELRIEGRPQVQGRVMSAETARVLTEILRGVVDSGTGTNARLDGFAVAGKTGTAQKVEPGTGRYSARARMSSFVGFVPADDPKLAILVVVDSPKKATYGGTVAAPVFRAIAEFGLERRGVRSWSAPVPELPPAAAPALLQPVSLDIKPPGVDPMLAGGMPSFLGLGMRDALVEARRTGLVARVDGSGYVIGQNPPPGVRTALGEVTLKFGSAID